MKIDEKVMKIVGKQWKSIKINKNQLKPMKIDENQWKSTKTKEEEEEKEEKKKKKKKKFPSSIYHNSRSTASVAFNGNIYWYFPLFNI